MAPVLLLQCGTQHEGGRQSGEAALDQFCRALREQEAVVELVSLSACEFARGRRGIMRARARVRGLW